MSFTAIMYYIHYIGRSFVETYLNKNDMTITALVVNINERRNKTPDTYLNQSLKIVEGLPVSYCNKIALMQTTHSSRSSCDNTDFRKRSVEGFFWGGVVFFVCLLLVFFFGFLSICFVLFQFFCFLYGVFFWQKLVHVTTTIGFFSWIYFHFYCV